MGEGGPERPPSLVPDEINKERGRRDKAPDEQKNIPEKEVLGLDAEAKEEGLLQDPEPEKELSQEEIEKIVMEKVPDIGAYGVAYSRLAALRYVKYEEKGKMKSEEIYQEECQLAVEELINKVKSVLQEGLLGTSWKEESKKRKGYESKEKWKEQARKKDAVVHFNFTGRAIHEMYDNKGYYYKEGNREKIPCPPQEEILYSDYVRGEKDKIVILFDADSFKEDPFPSFEESKEFPPARHYRASVVPGLRNYRNDAEEYYNNYFRDYLYKNKDRFGKVMPPAEYGFILSSRVAPRYFRGIMINPVYADKVVEIIREVKIPLPVLDYHGNMIWPKQMNYEEVKQFVAERDAKKSEGK